MSSVTIRTGDLRRLLTTVLPFAGKDDMLPAFATVHLYRRGDWLIAQATDRYRVGIMRVKHFAADGRYSATIPVREIKALLRILPTRRDQADHPVTLTAAVEVYTPPAFTRRNPVTREETTVQPDPIDLDVTRVDRAREGTAADVHGVPRLTIALVHDDSPRTSASMHAKVRKMTRESVAVGMDPQALGNQLLADPVYLGSFAHNVPVERGQGLLFAAGIETHTKLRVLVVHGQDFVGLIMPMRAETATSDPTTDRGWAELLADN